MSIIRRHKTENYSVISNNCIRNKSLSAKAKGIFCYIMTLPDDWKLYRTELANHFTDGKDSIRSGFDELIEAGYIKATQLRDETGKLSGWEYDIHETPPADLPIAENPPSDNPPLLSTKGELKTKENIGVLRDSNNSTAESSLPVELPNPREGGGPPSPSNRKASPWAKEAETRLVAGVGLAVGRKLVSKPTGEGIEKLLKAGVSQADINAAIGWLSEYSGGEFIPVVQSGKSFHEKWDKIQSAMARSSPAQKKETVVLKDGVIYFVHQDKVNGSTRREKFNEGMRSRYRVIPVEEYRKGAQ